MHGTSSSSAHAAQMALVDHLQELMADKGLSARQLSTRAGWHEAKTSKILNGRQRPTREDVVSWCNACEAPPEVLDRLTAQLQSVDSMWLDWRRAERHGMYKLNREVRELYERTRQFRIYSPSMIPGPVQTAEYVRALLSSLRERRGVAIDDIERTVAERMARQHIVYEGGHRFSILLEEASLRMQIGGPHVLAGALRHLLAIQSTPSMALGVIPLGADRTAYWPVEAFFIFDQSQVSVELVSGYLTVTAPAEIQMYEDGFARLAEAAVYGARARALIERALSVLE
ncbi:helix-turn-helix domain-containing protein [Actinospica robiniae]|uniref:helix-turn-helix domain-containing protein n=1 Tax=Actinospica robiniae TaxID=304901 RepID=UPI00040993E6|nr:helix-turn-helix transcriptional regulator [Actinospica robiniae]